MTIYWDTLLKDIMESKKNKNATSIKEPPATAYYNTKRTAQIQRIHQPKPHVRIYPLGEKNKKMYLTPREKECVLSLLKGYNVPETARNLKLSKRTVEFYLKKIKVKFNCPSNAKLVTKLKACQLDEQ